MSIFLFVFQNGPMRFFFRISQSQKGLVSAPVEKQLPAVINPPSVEQPSLTSTVSHCPSLVSRLSEISSPKVDNDAEEKRPLAHIRTPDTLIQTAAPTTTTTTCTQTPSNRTTEPDVKSQIVTSVTTSATQPTQSVAVKSAVELPTPIQVKSESPATTPSDTSCSKLPQTNLPETSKQNSTKFETITKTPPVSKPISPLTSDMTTKSIEESTVPNMSSRNPSQCSAAVSNDLTHQQTLSVTANCQQPVPALITKLPCAVADNKLPTELPTAGTATKELSQAAVAKTAVHPPSTCSTQPISQSSPNGEVNLTKSDQVLSSDVSNNTKTKPSSTSSSSSSASLPAGPVNAAHRVLPEQELPSGRRKQTDSVDCKESLVSEVKSKTEPDSTVKVLPDTASASKPVLGKSGQQRTQMFARNSSLISKVTPETTNNKTHLNTTKRPSSKDAKLPHVNHKVTDKQSSNGLNCRKDKLEDCGKKGFGKESSNNTSEPEKRQEKQITSPKNTPLSSNNSNNKCNNNNNNNNKAPQQSPQVMKNNQQILKKNDEIMRCANSGKRTAQITQRKPQDILKTFSGQHRGQEDKSSTKKRCVLATNPAKRLLVKSVDAAEHNELEPAAKKWRLGTENNNKVIHADQKLSQFKDKCISNSNECHTSKTVTEKPNGSEVAQIVSKTNRSHFQSLAPVEKTERQNNCKAHKNSVADKMQSHLPAQRPAHNSQPSGLAKHFDTQCRTPAPKTEASSPTCDATSPQVSASSACSRIAQSPSVPVPTVPAAAHSNANQRSQLPTLKRKLDGEGSDVGALDLSASPRRQQQSAIASIAQTLARRHHQQCPSPAPPPLSPLSSLSPFPVMSLPVRSPPPQLRIPVPQHYRSGHPQQQRPSSLSSSSPSPPADMLPGCSRPGLQQQPLDIYPSHMLPPSAVMFRQQLEMQRLWNSGKHSPNPCVEWFNDAKSIKSFENFMKNLQQQQQGNRNASFFPFNNTTSATNSHRK